MSEKEQAVDYIDNRLIKRTEFFEKRKREAIIFLIIFQVAIIVFSSTIPMINTVQFPDPSLVRITSALLGAVIAALPGIFSIWKIARKVDNIQIDIPNVRKGTSFV